MTHEPPPSQLPFINLQQLGDLCASTPDGLVVELGVYKGGSAYVLEQAAKRRPLHLYDTFTGIPETSPGDAFGIGAFNDTNKDAVQAAIPRAIIHAGFFPDTLTDDIQNVAFLHIDCDNYKSCLAALKCIWPRMVSGGKVAFDDWQFDGIQRAVIEFFGTRLSNVTDCGIHYFTKD